MELRDLYDENKNLTGETIYKGEEVPKGRYYITVVVFIQNSNNEFLLQKERKIKMENGLLLEDIQYLEKQADRE